MIVMYTESELNQTYITWHYGMQINDLLLTGKPNQKAMDPQIGCLKGVSLLLLTLPQSN